MDNNDNNKKKKDNDYFIDNNVHVPFLQDREDALLQGTDNS